MTSQLANRLRIHEPELVGFAAHGEAFALPAREQLESPHVDRPELEGDCLPSLWWREALHRRLLGVADVGAAAFALLLILNLLGQDRATLAALAVTPLVMVLFKVAGLYDRDELRLVHSTLDEAPLLAQLTGLFALFVAMLE